LQIERGRIYDACGDNRPRVGASIIYEFAS
jgi:hypothetical protein